MAISSDYDEHDIPMAPQKGWSHEANLFSHKELQSPHGRYDSLMNFSADHVKFLWFRTDKCVGIEERKEKSSTYAVGNSAIAVMCTMQLITDKANNGLAAYPENCHGFAMKMAESCGKGGTL